MSMIKKAKKKAGSKCVPGKPQVEVSPDFTSITVSQSVRQSANYQSVECSVSLTANTTPETVSKDISAVSDVLELHLGAKLKEQRELLASL